MRVCTVLSIAILSTTLVGMAMVGTAKADLQASADMVPTATPGGPYAYQYDLTLHNTGDTPISTFWYAWDDSDLNFLTSYPYNVNAPGGWYGYPTYGYAYDNSNNYVFTYGIEWYAYGAPLNPGEDLSGFEFQSDDTPAVLSGLSDLAPINPGDPAFPVGTSFVYQNYPPNVGVDPSSQFVVAPVSPVPEPASIGLLAAATMTGLLAFRRKAKRGTKQAMCQEVKSLRLAA